MGFSLVAAAAIIGVSIVMAIEIIVGTTIPTITDVHDSFDDMRDRAIDQVQTDINITNTARTKDIFIKFSFKILFTAGSFALFKLSQLRVQPNAIIS